MIRLSGANVAHVGQSLWIGHRSFKNKRGKSDFGLGISPFSRISGVISLSFDLTWCSVVQFFYSACGQREWEGRRGGAREREKNKNNPFLTPSWIQAMRWMRRIRLETSVVAVAVQGDSRQDWNKLTVRCCQTSGRMYSRRHLLFWSLCRGSLCPRVEYIWKRLFWAWQPDRDLPSRMGSDNLPLKASSLANHLQLAR